MSYVSFLYHFIFLLLDYLFIGFLPVFFINTLVNKKINETIVYAITFSVPFVALLQILKVSLNLGTWQFNLTILLLNLSLIAIIIRKDKFKKLSQSLISIRISLLLGLLWGCLMWLLFYKAHFVNKNIYIDTFWNISIIQEFGRQFPPVFPLWQNTTQKFIYHFLPNIFFAGLISTTKISSFKIILECGTLLIWIMLGLILSQFSQKKQSICLALIGGFFAFCFSLSQYWSPLNAFVLHLSSAISNFFWGLPVFMGGIYLWLCNNLKRQQAFLKYNQVSYKHFILITLITLILLYTKGSSALALVILEFCSALTLLFLLFHRGIRRYSLVKIIYMGLMFLVSPLMLWYLSKFMIGNQTLSKGGQIVRSKFIGLSTDDFFISFLIINGFTCLLFYFLKKRKPVDYLLIGATGLNFFCYYYFTHHSYSEVYFIFNCVILNLYFLNYLGWFRIKQSIVPASLCIFLLGTLFFRTDFKLIPLLKFSETSRFVFDSNKYDTEEFSDLANIGKHINNNAWVLMPEANCKNLYLAAALGRRIFAQCPFEVQTENPQKNYDVQNNLIKTTNLSKTECDDILQKYQIEGVVIANPLLVQDNSCIGYYSATRANNYIFYDLKN